jgi:predicted nucleic acid-binding protein
MRRDAAAPAPTTQQFRILIDTCVWLDLARDYHQQAQLGILEELIELGEISLIVPRVIVDEFARIGRASLTTAAVVSPPRSSGSRKQWTSSAIPEASAWCCVS